MLALSVNQMCLFASMDNAPSETCNIKNIKVNSFSGSSVLVSSVIQICDSECEQINPATESSRMESVCKYLKSVNHLQCTKILLQVSVYVNAVYRQFYGSISLSQFQFFSDIIKTWLRYASKKTCAARTAKGSLYNGKKIFSQKSQFWPNFFYLLQL